jgi:DNA-binding response OmpR family regulator
MGGAMDRSILVVDDDHDIAQILTELLTEEGYRVRCTFDGQAALREIAQDPPDLVLADVVMPQLDGVTLANQLRPPDSGIPVILISAVYDDVDVPGVHFLAKPFDLDALLRVVTRILGPQEVSVRQGNLAREAPNERPQA